MAGYRKRTKKLELSVGGAPGAEGRVWDAPIGSPVKDCTIWLSTRGVVTGAGDLNWRIIWGGNWSGGTPYDDDSTHADGIVVSNGAIGGGTEINHRILGDTNIFGTNLRDVHGKGGFPLVVELVNLKKAAGVEVWVTFLTWSIGEIV